MSLLDSLDWENLAYLATVVGVVLAFWGIISAARQNARAVESGILLTFMEHYAEPEMLDDLRALVSWQKDHSDVDFAALWMQRLREKDGVALRVDLARRRVKLYFRRPLMLYRQRYVGRRFVRAAASVDGINILREVVRPLELALNAKTTAHEDIDELVKICGPVGTQGILDYHPLVFPTGQLPRNDA